MRSKVRVLLIAAGAAIAIGGHTDRRTDEIRVA
jgi:hypothetical protein